MPEIHIEIDPDSGFCFGVVNAISKAEAGLAQGCDLYSLGDIVHNRMEVQRLGKLGLRTANRGDLGLLSGNPGSSAGDSDSAISNRGLPVGHNDPDPPVYNQDASVDQNDPDTPVGNQGLSVNSREQGAPTGKTLLIRAHGEPPSTYRTAQNLGMDIIDATCPVVARLQKVVVDAYDQMRACGGRVVLLGKRGHAEVTGLAGQVGDDVIVVESAEDLDTVDFSRPLFFLSQTTQSLDLFGEISREIVHRAADPSKVTVKDTICRQVSSREAKLKEFAGRFDMVIFVAGEKSSNGKVLFDACRRANPSSRHIEESSEVKPEWFEGVSSVGICGATSTPQWLMEDVAGAIRKIIN